MRRCAISLVQMFKAPLEPTDQHGGVVRGAVLAAPSLATPGSSEWIGRREAARRTQEKRPGALDPAERPWPFF